MIPVEKIKKIVKTYETLEKELASPNLEKKDFVKKSKEYSSIGDIINEAKGYIDFEKQKKEMKKIIDEKESCVLWGESGTPRLRICRRSTRADCRARRPVSQNNRAEQL
mgnify:CR=1 FL=1